MPHLKLEYSANLNKELDPKKIFPACHQVIVDTIGANLFHCQSRVTCSDAFYIGDGNPLNAFVYLEVLLFEGRDLIKLQEMRDKLLKVLERALITSSLILQIAVHITEFPRSHYEAQSINT